MFNVFRQLVQAERPDYILETKTAVCNQLEAITCKYGKAGKYYVAVSFCTETWISSSPVGPLTEDISTVRCLGDVATITEFDSKQVCLSYPAISNSDLSSCIFRVNRVFQAQVRGLLEAVDGDELSYAFLLSPVPSFVIKIINNSIFIGSIVVLPGGNVFPVTVCDNRVYGYVEQLAGVAFSFGGAIETGRARAISPMRLGEG